ncbi:MAG: MoxR family ATPase [Bacteroidia bacterium]|nr:MoxR family ATPase [Bacteroidia bacterium]
MPDNQTFEIYKGDGSTIKDRNITLPEFEKITRMEAPEGYVAAPALRDAVNVAIALGQPLLLTGEPGTGKTRLAYSIAHELGLGMPKIFNTKTTSTARDLFYRYDSLGHFHDAQLRDKSKIDIREYITYEAMGQAIIESKEKRSVVLIDEVDKAPRDLPNDILNELENMNFAVKETGDFFEAHKPNRPILILTSNSEKNLPDAFLRRVIYYHIPFPDKETLEKIISNRLVISEKFRTRMLADAISHFMEIRKNKGLRKLPATAELLAWIHILERHEIDINSDIEAQINKLAMSYSILAKNKEDLEKLRRGLA